MLALPDRVYYIIEETHGCKEDLDMAQVVTKDMIIADILAVDPGNAAILMADEVLEQINEYLAKKEQ